MCVIYCCNSKLPDTAELRRGAFRNDDGAGIAWLEKDKKSGELVVAWEKGLKDEEAVLDFIKREEVPFPLVIHFRTASVGGKMPGLCHPFPVSSDVPLWTAGTASEVLFHNGHLGNWEELLMAVGFPSTERFPVGPWSDTRALAWITYLKGAGVLDFIIRTSRVLLFSAEANTLNGEEYDPSEDHITLFGSGWIHRDGFSQSIATDSYYTTPRYTKGYVHNAVDADDDSVLDAALESMMGDNKKPAETPKSTSPVVYTAPPAVWTVAELRTILKSIEEEQAHAQLAAGV